MPRLLAAGIEIFKVLFLNCFDVLFIHFKDVLLVKSS
jgi:hypothetical protein